MECDLLMQLAPIGILSIQPENQIIKNIMNKIKTTLTALALSVGFALTASGQITTLINDNFNTSQGTTFTTTGVIGTSDWTATRSGDDWGARIDGGILELTNTASSASNADGWVFANTTLTSSGNFNTTLENSSGLVTWSFNMQQIRSNPAGFGTNSYGAAFVLASSSQTVASAGNGYAVVLGNTATPDPIRLVSFTGGIQSIGNVTGGIVTATTELTNPTTSHMSILVTYNPADNQWALFGRNDGSSFADPLSGTLIAMGTGTNDTHTNVALGFAGAYWQGSMAGSQTAKFDNVTLTAVPEPATYAAIIGLMALGLVLVRRRMNM